MARPNTKGVHIDGLLSNLSIAIMQDMNQFVFNKVFKIVPVDLQSNLYPVYDSDDFNTDEAQIRNDSTETAGSGYDLSDEQYLCKVFGFHKDIGEQLRANAAAQFNLDREATEFVTRKIMLKQEREWITKFMTSGCGWDETLTGGTDFDQFSEPTSTPISMLKGEIRTMLEETGLEPNTLVLGPKVFDDMTEHPDFVDRVKHVSSDSVTAQIMAKLIGIDRILVAKSVVASGKGATKTTAFNSGRSALLCYAAPNPGLITPSAGYTFSWNYAGVGAVAIEKFYIREKKTTRVEAEAAFDNKITAASLGKLLLTVTGA